MRACFDVLHDAGLKLWEGRISYPRSGLMKRPEDYRWCGFVRLVQEGEAALQK